MSDSISDQRMNKRPNNSGNKKLRTSIYQASWNYQHKDTFPFVALIIAMIIGITFESWWMFLTIMLLLFILPDYKITVGIFSLLWALMWTILISLPVGIYFSIGAGVTTAFFVFSMSYVPMRSSEQYWRDLEKDGGPYSD